MEQSVLKNPDLVVALDIGSTYSGYAWQWRSDFKKNRRNIEFNDNWGTATLKLRKTTTCLLLDENKDVDSFGQVAEQRFCNECAKTEHGDLTGRFYFFKGFKMLLYDQDPNEIKIDDHFGQPLPLIEVMSKFIQTMREHFLCMIRRKNQRINLNKTLWVVTVPAIWSDAAKQFMRNATENGGIERKNLLIAYEPEAAALHCIHLPSEERKAMGDLGEKGTSFITIDLGGETTDVLALKVLDNGMLEEICSRSGDRVGGQNINDAFFQACTDAFKDNIWSKIAYKSHAEELLSMENDFESKKVVIRSTEPIDEMIALSMPESFRKLLDNDEIQLNTSQVSIFKLERSKLLFSSQFIRGKLFNETIQRVSKCISEILNRQYAQDISTVVLVGGFSESPLVEEKIGAFLAEKFPSKKLVVPTSPLTSVLSGAVLFGHDPMIFRISRATYGIETNRIFDGKIHRLDKKWTNKETGVDRCKDILSIHREKGQPVKLGIEQQKRYTPMYKDKKRLSLPISMSTADNLQKPAYINDEKCKKIGEIEVDMPDTRKGDDRRDKVTMIYGRTDLDAVAKDNKSALKNPDLVVALDIGSTYSGYAWQWRSDFEKNRRNIEFNDNWGAATLKLRKTTTCLLLDENKKVDSFGQLAEQRFCNECDKTEHTDLTGKFYFFKGFKMLPYDHDPNMIKIEDYSGQLLPLIDVMSKFIQAMREHFLNMIRRKNQRIKLNNTLWVVTVPAIWSNAAKQFMRSAAEKGGIKRQNLLIAHEPEAAALHCIHLPEEEKKAMGDLGEKGTSFITIDLGGGTTDVLALKVLENGMLEEICLGTGDRVGGQNINDAFFQAFKDAFKDNAWLKISDQSNAEEILSMENEFESKKVVIGSTDPRDEFITLSMPASFRKSLEKGEIQLKASQSSIFKVKKNKLLFSSQFIREKLFKETIQRVSKCIGEILKRESAQNISTVVLVGGFSESHLVVEKIEAFLAENFPSKNLVVPMSPFTAVLSGAVLYGHDPMIFLSRISRATYGIAANENFDENIHRLDKKWKNEETGVDKCKDIFDIHIEKGSSVRLKMEQPSQTYIPINEKQKYIRFRIFMSTADHLERPAYITDDKCKQIGEIVVEMPDTKKGLNRSVIVTMIYGGTELDVIAKDKTTGKEYKSHLNLTMS